MRRRRWGRQAATAVAVSLVVALVAVACGVDVGSDSATTTGPVVDAPTYADVLDDTFGGLGDPRIDVSRYDVALRTSPGTKAISGTVRITARVTSTRPLDAFSLDLHHLTVHTARVDGQPARTEVHDDQVLVIPTRPLAPRHDLTAVLTYGGEPEALSVPSLPRLKIGWQADDRGGTFTLSEPYGTRTWMPVSDHPSDKAAFHFRIDVPDGVQAVANGVLVGSQPSTTAGRTVWTWDQPEPMAPYLALVAVGHYDLVRRAGRGGLPVVEAFPAGQGSRLAHDYQGLDAMLTFLQGQFGPYPFRSVGVIVVPAPLQVALETQTRPLFGEGPVAGDDVLVHELAHQWFGDDVSLDRWHDIWLNEGFATYAEWLWSEHSGGQSVASLATDTRAQLGTKTGSVDHPDRDEVFGQTVYQRGAVTLYALRRTVGDPTFTRILRDWVGEYGGTSATTQQFEAVASADAGRDLTAFFRSWLDDEVVPPLP